MLRFKLLVIAIVLHACAVSQQEWSLRTDDTRITLAVGADKKCRITDIGHTSGLWNWGKNAVPLRLIELVETGGKKSTTNWSFVNTEQHGDSSLSLHFTNSTPALALKVVFEAKKGPGPIRYSMFLHNNSGTAITIYNPESLDLTLALPKSPRLTYINDDASLPDSIGIYHHALSGKFDKKLVVSESHDWIPFFVVDAANTHGLYSGWEWSHGRMYFNSSGTRGNFRIGVGEDFRTDLAAGEIFEIPPGFIGAYKGDLDDCGNSLRRYLFNHAMPARIVKDSSFPRTEWNAFAALGKEHGSWDPVESKYYPWIDDIAPLGFEEVVIDVGWWSDYGDPGHIITDPVDWPSGMVAAARYAKNKGMRFGLYDNEPEDLTTTSGVAERIRDVSYLINNLEADFYRSDATAGPVTKGSYGKEHRAKYKEDVAYWATKGFYKVIDSLYKILPGFMWENCASGGGLKDYGAVRRAGRVQNQDVYWPIEARKSFYDASHAFHTMQLACVVGSWKPWKAEGSVYEFRSASMGASYWHPDAPNGGNGGPVWTEQQKKDIARAVATYKEKLRPLIRNANLYHVFKRPDNIRWDGVEYYDPATRSGVVYIFKPEKATTNTHTVKLKGLERNRKYRITFEDKTNADAVVSGSELMSKGITLKLQGSLVSELMFFEAI